MREIKFRAWDKEHEKMTISYTLNELIANGGPFHKMFQADYIFMQFTGLHDKNGKKIYEGDILSNTDGSESVFWGDRIGMWLLEDVEGNSAWLSDYCSVMEVIGNIYENPELLERS